MKVLTNNTADKLLRLLAGRGTPPPRSVPRPAPTAPDPLNWRITVVPSTGVVSVGQGTVYLNGVRVIVAAAVIGTATGNHLVVWTASGISLEDENWSPSASTGNYRILGKIVKSDSGSFSARQYCADPIEVYTVTNGVDGRDAGVTVSTAAAGTSASHPNGGTTVTLQPTKDGQADGQPESFTIWNGANGQDAHWGTAPNSAFNPAVTSDDADQGETYPHVHTIPTAEVGKVVHMSGVWITAPSNVAPGGVLFTFREQQIDLHVDSRGNVRELVKAGRVVREVDMPVGTPASVAINSNPSINNADMAAHCPMINGGRVVNLTSTWIDNDGNYGEQQVVLYVDSYGAVRNVNTANAQRGRVVPLANTSGENKTLILSGVPYISGSAAVGEVYISVPKYQLEFENGLLKTCTQLQPFEHRIQIPTPS